MGATFLKTLCRARSLTAWLLAGSMTAGKHVQCKRSVTEKPLMTVYHTGLVLSVRLAASNVPLYCTEKHVCKYRCV